LKFFTATKAEVRVISSRIFSPGGVRTFARKFNGAWRGFHFLDHTSPSCLPATWAMRFFLAGKDV
jgi:hypothetical protein